MRIDNEGERSENAQHHSLHKVHLIQSPSIHYKQLIPQEQVSAGKLYTKKQAKQVKKIGHLGLGTTVILTRSLAFTRFERTILLF